MGFTVKENDYVVGADMDWQAILVDHEDGGLKLEYRFRYYDPEDPGNDPFSGKDRKTWFAAAPPPGTSREAAREVVQQMAETLAAAMDSTPVPGVH